MLLSKNFEVMDEFLRFIVLTLFIVCYFNQIRAFQPSYPDSRSVYFKMQLKNDTVDAKLKLSYYDSLMCRLPNEIHQLSLGKAAILRDMEDQKYNSEALKMYEKIYQMKDVYNLRDRMETLYTIGTLYIRQGKLYEALQSTGQLLSYPLPDSLSYYKVKACLSLCNIFVELSDEEKLDVVVNRGLELVEKVYVPNSIYPLLKSGLLSRKAYLMGIKGKFSEAIGLYEEAKKICPTLVSRINMSIGSLFSLQNQHDIAYRYYLDGLKHSGNPEIRAVSAFNIAKGYIQTRQYDDFFEFIHKYENELNFFRGQITEAQLWSLKSEAYEIIGNYRDALGAHKISDSIQSEIMSKEKIRDIEREYQQIDMKEKNKEIEELRLACKKRDIMSCILVVIGIFLVSCLTVMIIRNNKRRVYKDKKHKKEEDECRKEMERRKENQEEMEATLKLRNQEVAYMSMKLASISEKMVDLKDLVGDPKAKKVEIIAEVQSALREVSSDGELWDSFRIYFEGVNQSFFDRLYHLHPDLTNAEIRMCVFILLNRTNKEIATILNRSTRTIETIKYNLRKKLGITETTESYLRSISAGEKCQDASS